MDDMTLVGPAVYHKSHRTWNKFRAFEQCFGQLRYCGIKGPEYDIFNTVNIRYWNGEIQPYALLFIDRQSSTYCFGVVDGLRVEELIKVRHHCARSPRLQLLDRRLECYVVALDARPTPSGYVYQATLLADDTRPNCTGLLPMDLESQFGNFQVREFWRYFKRSAKVLPHKLSEPMDADTVKQTPNFFYSLDKKETL